MIMPYERCSSSENALWIGSSVDSLSRSESRSSSNQFLDRYEGRSDSESYKSYANDPQPWYSSLDRHSRPKYSLGSPSYWGSSWNCYYPRFNQRKSHYGSLRRDWDLSRSIDILTYNSDTAESSSSHTWSDSASYDYTQYESKGSGEKLLTNSEVFSSLTAGPIVPFRFCPALASCRIPRVSIRRNKCNQNYNR